MISMSYVSWRQKARFCALDSSRSLGPQDRQDSGFPRRCFSRVFSDWGPTEIYLSTAFRVRPTQDLSARPITLLSHLPTIRALFLGILGLGSGRYQFGREPAESEFRFLGYLARFRAILFKALEDFFQRTFLFRIGGIPLTKSDTDLQSTQHAGETM